MIGLLIVQIYLALGLISGIALLLRGLYHIDPDTSKTSWGFKALLFPGILIFWPYFIYKWITN